MVRCNAIPVPIPASGDPIQSIPASGAAFGSSDANNILSQFSPSANPPSNFGSNTRPNYFGSSSPLMPFPTFINQQPPLPPPQPQQQQFGAQPSYPYLNLYAGNANVGSSPQQLPYYGHIFRPYQGGHAPSGGLGTYGGASLMPYSSRFQTNLQFGGHRPLQPTLFDRMDTVKPADEQEKKSTQQ